MGDYLATAYLRSWRGKRVFVCSLADLFHDEVPDEYIARVFAVMALAPELTFQVLTKRPARMRALLSDEREFSGLFGAAWGRIDAPKAALPTWPLPNVWLGVTVEDQQRADQRIPILLDTPAAVRWLSVEPMLGPVDLWDLDTCDHKRQACIDIGCWRAIDWVVCGGESGPNARPMHPDWARSLRDQCAAAGVPFMLKQWGEWSPNHHNIRVSSRRWQYESVSFAPDGTRYRATEPDLYSYPGMESMLRVGKRAAGRLLDGVLHDGYPGGEQ